MLIALKPGSQACAAISASTVRSFKGDCFSIVAWASQFSDKSFMFAFPIANRTRG